MRTKEKLTPTEQECLLLLASGLSSQEIADQTQRSKRTVDFHCSNLYAKMEVQNRTQAVVKALQEGLITL